MRFSQQFYGNMLCLIMVIVLQQVFELFSYYSSSMQFNYWYMYIYRNSSHLLQPLSFWVASFYLIINKLNQTFPPCSVFSILSLKIKPFYLCQPLGQCLSPLTLHTLLIFVASKLVCLSILFVFFANRISDQLFLQIISLISIMSSFFMCSWKICFQHLYEL